jgi:hypothetical protein
MLIGLPHLADIRLRGDREAMARRIQGVGIAPSS